MRGGKLAVIKVNRDRKRDDFKTSQECFNFKTVFVDFSRRKIGEDDHGWVVTLEELRTLFA